MVIEVVARKGASAPDNLCLHKSLGKSYYSLACLLYLTLLYVLHVFMCKLPLHASDHCVSGKLVFAAVSEAVHAN